MTDAAAARALVARIAATPRPAGSDAEEDVRRFAEERLSRAGFEVSRQSFEYSAFPGRWATPLGGVLAAMVVCASGALTLTGRHVAGLMAMVAGSLLLAVGSAWMARTGVLRVPFQRRRGINLVAERGEPTLWLVAHLDTKSQPVSMLFRVLGITGLIAAGVGMSLLEALSLAGVIDGAASAAGGLMGLAAVAALPVAASVVDSRSPGAVDDASGVATVLLAAESLPHLPLGVLLTTAEELGLPGARHWTAGRAPDEAINVDGVDDGPTLMIMTHRRRPGRLARRIALAASRTGARARIVRGVPGVLTDGVALRDAGWDAVTLSSGTLDTLRRVHTPRDRADALSGSGAARAVAVIVAAVGDQT